MVQSWYSLNAISWFLTFAHLCAILRAAHHWAWVPVVACSLGGVLGGIVYILFIELHHSSSDSSNNYLDHPYRPVNNGPDAPEEQL